MPWEGAWWLQEYAGKKIGAKCHRCGLEGVWEADELLHEYGSYRMTDLLDTIAISNCCTRLDNQWYDRCGLSYDPKYLLVDEKEIAKAEAGSNPFDGLSIECTFDDLREWHELRGHCLLCGAIGGLSKKRLERRFGRYAKIRSLNKMLYCTKCKLRGGAIIRIHKLPR